MRKALVLLCALVAGVGSGCAFTNITVPLPPNQSSGTYSQKVNKTVAVQGFEDRRQIKDRIGMKKNNYNQDTASAFPGGNILEWFTERLKTELQAAGFQTVSTASPSTIAVQGTLYKVFTEPVIQWSTVDVETDVSMEIQVTKKDGFQATRRYFEKGQDTGMMATEDHYGVSLRTTVDALMKRIVADIANLLHRLPD